MMKMRRISVLLVVLILSLVALLQPVAMVHSQAQGQDTKVTALVLFEKDGEVSKEIVMAIEALGVEVLAGTARQGHPAVLVRLPKGKTDAVMALSGVIAVQIPPPLPEPEPASLSAFGALDFTRHPGHGADARSEMQVTAKDLQRQSVMRDMADEWANVSQLDALSDTELAKVDGVVRSQAYWAVFADSRVEGKVEAEVKRASQAGGLTALAADSMMALQSAANEQTISVIIELDVFPGADKIAAISSRVERVRHVLKSINAVSADLTSAQLAAVVRLPFVRRIWSNGLVRGQVNQSAQQIGAHEIRNMGIDGSGVRVAVVDNGLQDDHPEYDGRVVAERFNIDDGDHATHVAGIILDRRA